MMFMLVLLGIGAVLDLISIFTSTTVIGIILNVLIAAFAVYLFLVVLSLYQKIKIENLEGNTNAGGIVYNPGYANQPGQPIKP